jgi:type I restriction enzyme S subunit
MHVFGRLHGRAACASIDQTIPNLDSLQAEAEHAIELLKERRAALISAAITGKIDVRNV